CFYRTLLLLRSEGLGRCLRITCRSRFLGWFRISSCMCLIGSLPITCRGRFLGWFRISSCMRLLGSLRIGRRYRFFATLRITCRSRFFGRLGVRVGGRLLCSRSLNGRALGCMQDTDGLLGTISELFCQISFEISPVSLLVHVLDDTQFRRRLSF